MLELQPKPGANSRLAQRFRIGLPSVGRTLLFVATIAFFCLHCEHADAASFEHALTETGEQGPWRARPGLLLAQADGDDTYDPFADYSEFEESMDEEEDVNFFRNGRLLTIGFLLGYRGWTGQLAQIYTGTPAFGLFMSYFFDLRFALQFSYLTSDHVLAVPGTTTSSPVQGSINLTDLGIAVKYYFNTQNVTRGLADLNPYAIVGFSQIYRSFSISGNNAASKDSAFGLDAGGGLEIPMMRNKMYFGAQLMYQLVNFPDSGSEIQDANDHGTGVFPRGNTWTLMGIIGSNF